MVGLTLAAFGIIAAIFQGGLSGPAVKRFGEHRVALFGLVICGHLGARLWVGRLAGRGADPAGDPRAGRVRASHADRDHVQDGAGRCAGRVAGRYLFGDEHRHAGRHGLFLAGLRAFHAARGDHASRPTSPSSSRRGCWRLPWSCSCRRSGDPFRLGRGRVMERFTGSFTQQEPIPEDGHRGGARGAAPWPAAPLQHRARRDRRDGAAGGRVRGLHGRAVLPGCRLGRLCDGDRAAGRGGRAGRPGPVQRLHARPGAGRDCRLGRGAGLCRGDGGPDHRPGRSGREGRDRRGEGAAAQPHAGACLRHGSADGHLRRGGRAR